MGSGIVASHSINCINTFHICMYVDIRRYHSQEKEKRISTVFTRSHYGPLKHVGVYCTIPEKNKINIKPINNVKEKRI